MFEADIDGASDNRYAPKDELPEEGAVASAGRKTQETLTATDLIIEALDMAEAEIKRIAEYEVLLPIHSCNFCPINSLTLIWSLWAS